MVLEMKTKCPETDEETTTWIRFDRAEYLDTATLENVYFRCQACGKDHLVDKDASYLVEVKVSPFQRQRS